MTWGYSLVLFPPMDGDKGEWVRASERSERGCLGLLRFGVVGYWWWNVARSKGGVRHAPMEFLMILQIDGANVSCCLLRWIR